MSTIILHSSILVLLPLVPAIILFKFLPSKGGATGKMLGMQWKFGGAFAGYLIVFLLLQNAISPLMGIRDSEVWTVRGKIDAERVANIENLAVIKLHPQIAYFAPDGSYEFQVIVNRVGDQLRFPKVLLDLRRLCSDVRTISLDNSGGTFAAIAAPTAIKVTKNDAARAFDIQPIALAVHDTTADCSGI